MQPHLVLVPLVLLIQLTRCQRGGPISFGYDAASVCNRPYSRSGRAHIENLPCDFRVQNWCTVAGNAYPWHAVRRFVQENQGLMRRMYGDERHINILKTELEKNDVELEYDDRYQRYSDESRHFQYDDVFDAEVDFYDLPKEEEYPGRSFTGRAFDVPGNGKPARKFRGSLKPKARPFFPNENAESTTATSSSQTTDGFSTSEETKPTVTTTTANSAMVTESNSTTDSSSSTEASAVSNETTSMMMTVTTSTTATNVSEESGSQNASTTPFVTLAQIAKIQNFSINEISGQIDRFDGDVEKLTELPNTPETTLEENVTPKNNPIKEPVDAYPSHSSEEDTSRFNFQEQVSTEAQHPQQQFRPRPEYRPYESKFSTSAKPEAMEAQLYQDVAAKDQQQEQPVLKLRGVNACPVKEEVVAPFWANNTRGEVLALLNLYPFEQYVHWEKCTHEHKQMYCRDGCRCEQQYRLHRLLAYDPNNECRGIFSDWFKFPSCCVCRCYDLPIEFRVTSRSPRVMKQKRKIKLRNHRDYRG